MSLIKPQPLHTIFIVIILLLTLTIQSYSSTKLKLSNKILTFELTPKQSTSSHNLSFISLTKIHNFLSKVNITNDKETITLFQQELTKKITEYSGKVQIGNPPQELEMVFDTGSANILVTSSYCTSSVCSNHNKYDPFLSTSSEQINHFDEYTPDLIKDLSRDRIFITFGTGQVKCYLAYDDVCIGEGKLCSNHHIILQAYEESSVPFSHVKFDGIIGLSFTYLSVSPKANFIEMLYQQKKISNRVFSFYFNINDQKKSILNIGGYSQDYFEGNITYTDVISRNYWEISIEEIYYGDTMLFECHQNSCSAIIDTGTSMIAAPSIAYNLLTKVSKIGFDCSGIELLQNLQFKINGVMFHLEPEFFILQINSLKGKGKNCINAFMQLDALSTESKYTFLLGLPFFKKYYTIFDRENKRIGFALAKHDRVGNLM